MKAAVVTRYGHPEVLEIADVPPPQPRPGEVLVDVYAAGVNPVDAYVRRGDFAGLFRFQPPIIPGHDFSGVVRSGGSRFHEGDAVMGMKRWTFRELRGSYAEQVSIAEAELARKPSNLSHEEAAALPLAGLTSWDALVKAAKLQRGQKVLIHAGSGGVGTIAIQLAKWQGAYVATTCGPHNVELVRSLGADLVIDYTQARFEDKVSGYDAVLLAIPDVEARSVRVLRKNGTLVTLMAPLPPGAGPIAAAFTFGVRIPLRKLWARAQGVRYIQISVLQAKHSDELSRISELAEQGALRPVIERVYSLEEVQQAHDHLETGHARGKIVLRVRANE